MVDFSINNLDLKLQALEEAISYPTFRSEIKDTITLEMDNFDYDIISDKIKNNEKLTNLEGAKIDLILDVINLLYNNKKKFNVDIHKYIGFYWRGLPILIIKINREPTEEPPPRMMYISVKVFKDELADRIADKKMSRAVVGTLGGILILGGLITGYIFMNKNSS